MSASSPFTGTLPPEATPAMRIAKDLVAAGHRALLAGGCVRDLLLNRLPHDYDVATDAKPEAVCELFQATRKVGAQFGVVLVRMQRKWVEVATFRADGEYLDGRRPTKVTFCDARADAQRRDFTINGMFLDPLGNTVIDYVGGRDDLQARLIRAIGEPQARFEEDHLRLLRAVRFAARLEFEIEPKTFAAICTHAAKLASVAHERVREELEKMLGRSSRHAAVRLLCDAGLLGHLWAGATWENRALEAALSRVERLGAEATFEAAFAALVADRDAGEVGRICRDLTFSNEQRATTSWLVRHQTDLDDADADALPLANLKRLMAHRAFAALLAIAESRFRAMPDGPERSAALRSRLDAIDPSAVQPPPWITGADLIERGVAAGPTYKKLLDALYTRQLDEELATRAQALCELDELLERLPAD